MIRNVGEKIRISKYVEVEEIVTKQKIVSIVVKPEMSSVEVSISLINNQDESVAGKVINISGDDYDLLFSDANYFGDDKQAGTFKEADLWKMIDKLT